MSSADVARGSLTIRLWPESYAVARLHGLPEPMPHLESAGAPVALIVGNDEVSLLAPERILHDLRPPGEEVSTGWRCLTLDAVLPLDTVGVLAAASRALAEVGVPLMTFSSHATDHFLVPGRLLGRALAALNQASLERLLPRS